MNIIIQTVFKKAHGSQIDSSCQQNPAGGEEASLSLESALHYFLMYAEKKIGEMHFCWILR